MPSLTFSISFYFSSILLVKAPMFLLIATMILPSNSELICVTIFFSNSKNLKPTSCLY